jgi:ubiquinone/menaquinone biosynthesis C-methylase UbiE
MSLTETANAQHFDSVAKSYDEQFGLSVEVARARVRHIVDNSEGPILPGHVLDLGCGTGNLSAALLAEGVATTCIGFDISAGMVEIAREKTAHMEGISFQVGSATELPFDDNSFDLVVGDAFLHHILDTQASLRETHRVLKPGGVASFNEPHGPGYALIEFILRNVQIRDSQIDQYIGAIRFLREHAGDLPALEEFPLPDKHYFTQEYLIKAGTAAGFSKFSAVPAMGPSAAHWQDALKFILDALQPKPFITARVLQSAQLLDETVGDDMRRHFCLHNQNYFYK